jgi:hypothetical protein
VKREWKVFGEVNRRWKNKKIGLSFQSFEILV